jgi:hypothetical protein
MDLIAQLSKNWKANMCLFYVLVLTTTVQWFI